MLKISRLCMWTLGLMGLGVVSVALLVMVETDSLLRLLEAEDGTRFGMDTLQGLRFSTADEAAAIKFWRSEDSALTHEVAWVNTYLVADTLFACAYGLLLLLVFRKCFGHKWQWAGLAPAAADLVENCAIAARVNTDLWWLGPIVIYSFIKWLLLGIALFILLVVLARRLPGQWSAKVRIWYKVTWRFRIQAGVVVLLAALIAVPSADRLGMLQQLPDVLRGAHCAGDCPGLVRWMLLSTLALLGLMVTVWVSGHWLPFSNELPPDAKRNGFPWRREGLWLAIAGGAAVYAAIAVSLWQRWIPVKVPKGLDDWLLGLAPLLAALLLTAVFIAHQRRTWKKEPAAYPKWTKDHAMVLNALTAAVLTCGGLAVARAFIGPLLLLPGNRNKIFSTDLDQTIWRQPEFGWFVFGVGAAAVVAPALFWCLGKLNRAEWDPGHVIRQVPWPVTYSLVGIAVVTVALAASHPETFGEQLGVNGVLAAALAVICLVGGGLVALSYRSSPLWAWHEPREKKCKSTEVKASLPTFALVLALFTVLGAADRAGTYHDVNLRDMAPAAPVSIADSFEAWLAAANACDVPSRPAQSDQWQPMLFVSAAGGGIRASYWTEMVLNHLSTATCGNTNIFLVSSVSGASVGTALWSDPDRDLTKAGDLGSDSLTDRRELGALGTAWLFRDLPRAFLGYDPPKLADRAEVFENSWIDNQKTLKRRFPDDALPQGQGWRPITILNSTDLLTSCRIAVTRLAPPEPMSQGHCDDPDAADPTLPGTFYAQQFAWDAACESPRAFSAATAAMLSARFPFVTPSGNLYACEKAELPVLLQAGDGGYLENSGILSALQVWRQVRPMIAAHNHDVAQSNQGRVIVPFFLVIGNSYRSDAEIQPRDRTPELMAPAGARDAQQALGSPQRLEVETRALFSGQVPGTKDEVLIGCYPHRPGSAAVRFAAAAPRSRPEVTAPLGWALSDYTTTTLKDQWDDLRPELNCVFNLLNREVASAPATFTPD